MISHHKTLKEAGLCDQAEINVQGEDEDNAEAKAKQEQADKVDIHNAAQQGKIADVQLVLGLLSGPGECQRLGDSPWRASRCC